MIFSLFLSIFCLLSGDDFVIYIIVLVYLLLVEKFWMICVINKRMGVYILIWLYVGNNLMSNVEKVIKIMVVVKMIFFFNLFLILLNIILFNGCIKKVIVNVVNVNINLSWLFLIVLKKFWLIIMVKYEYKLKLNYFIVFFIFVVKMFFLVLLIFMMLIFFLLNFILLCYFCGIWLYKIE